MRNSGCIAVSGGLECVNDRLLSLMRKGITLSGAKDALIAFRNCGIMAHAYLMYGFPTQTLPETLDALEYVKNLYIENLIQSSYWHRFALTAHSEIARDPEKFAIKKIVSPVNSKFAINELHFEPFRKYDIDALGKALHIANYNYCHRKGLDLPVDFWLNESNTN